MYKTRNNRTKIKETKGCIYRKAVQRIQEDLLGKKQVLKISIDDGLELH